MLLLISAGCGPIECQLAVRRLTDMMLAEAGGWDLQARVVAAEPAAHGLWSSTVAVDGDEVAAFATSWIGTILWICRSPLRPGVRHKNWFVRVSQGFAGGSQTALPPGRGVSAASDLRYDMARTAGAGGQQVNTTDAAARVTHLPTGISATAQRQRIQHRNRAIGTAGLATVGDAGSQLAQQTAEQTQWMQHNTPERNTPVRIYRGERFAMEGCWQTP